VNCIVSKQVIQDVLDILLSPFKKKITKISQVTKDSTPLTLLQVVEETEDVEEKIDKIKVETDRSQDVLVRRQTVIDHVCVINNIAAEDEATTDSKHHVHGAAEGQEDGNEAGDAETHQSCEEEGPQAGEVILGLEGKYGQPKEDADRDEESLKDECRVDKRHGNAQCESLEKREGREKN